MILIVTCSKCWNDVILKEYNDNGNYEGECENCMVGLSGRVEYEN